MSIYAEKKVRAYAEQGSTHYENVIQAFIAVDTDEVEGYDFAGVLSSAIEGYRHDNGEGGSVILLQGRAADILPVIEGLLLLGGDTHVCKVITRQKDFDKVALRHEGFAKICTVEFRMKKGAGSPVEDYEGSYSKMFKAWGVFDEVRHMNTPAEEALHSCVRLEGVVYYRDMDRTRWQRYCDEYAAWISHCGSILIFRPRVRQGNNNVWQRLCN